MDQQVSSTDVLSDMLRIVRLSGAIFLKGSFGAPWAVASGGRKGIAHLLRPGAKHVTIFHMIAEGQCRVETSGCEPVVLGPGDLILLPFGDRHVLRNGAVPPIESDDLVADLMAEGVMTLNVGAGGERTTIVCGYVQSNELLFSPVFSTLPPLIVDRTAQEPVTSLLANSARLLLDEAEALRPGSRDLLGRLMEMLFVEMLRRHATRLSPNTAGWFGALNDPVVGRALQAMHAQPTAEWTVESLALHVGASRSVLAERFKTILGQPPMQYLGAWRVQLATDMLREHRRSIADIAVAVGYESEAAFNRAFKRHLGLPPGAWRDQAGVLSA